MQVGDKKKAGVLGVVAVGAIGFLILQLVPKAGAQTPQTVPNPTVSASPANSPSPSAPSSPPSSPSSARVDLLRDPLAPIPRPYPQPSVTTAVKDAPGGELPPTVPAVPPVTIAGTASVPALTPATVDVRGEPGSPANPSVQKLAFKPASKSEAVKEKIEITLLGVVESDRPVAMLRVGGSERTARVGDEIVPGLRIESVTLSGLTFVKRPGVLLAPGDQILL